MYRWVEHTSELELRIEAADDGAVFAEALAALAELLGEGASAAEAEGGAHLVLREVVAYAPDRATLLAEWLGELVFLAETEALIPEGLEDLQLAPDALRATVRARPGEPAHLVKAVTYHRLVCEQVGDSWHASVVLDV